MPENLYIKVFGGTLASEKNEAANIVPKRGKVLELLEHEVSQYEKDRYGDIVVEEEEPFLDSADARAETIESMVSGVRAHVRKRAAPLLIVTGTDTAAHFLQALADGLPPDQLGDSRIMTVVAQKASPKRPKSAVGSIGQEGSDAANNLTNALYLLSALKTRGQISLCCGNALFPARGLIKEQLASRQPFACRYGPLAISDQAVVPNWTFQQPPISNADRAAGAAGRYKLLPNISTFTLTPFTDYRRLPKLVVEPPGPDSDSPNCVILEVPGNRNVRQKEVMDRESFRKAVDVGARNGIPIVVVSETMQQHAVGNGIQDKYKGDVSMVDGPVVDGGRLTRIEVEVVVSNSLHLARKSDNLSGPQVVERVRRDLQMYMDFVEGRMSADAYVNYRNRDRIAADSRGAA